MGMLSVCVFVFALMVLTQATGPPEAWTGNNQTANSHLVDKRRTCPRGWTPIRARCFLYVPKAMTWARAERNCLSMWGHLASVNSINEYHEIQKLIATATHDYRETWIGGTDAPGENFWFWSDGSHFHYSNWCPGEPNNHGGQHCLQMNFGASKCWDDMSCYAHRPSVCVRYMW